MLRILLCSDHVASCFCLLTAGEVLFPFLGEQKVLPIWWLATIPLLLRIWGLLPSSAWEHSADTDPLAGLPVRSSLEQARIQTGGQRQGSCPASSDLPGRGHGAPHGTWLSFPTGYGCLWARIRNLIRGPLMFSLLPLSSSSFRNWISRGKKDLKAFLNVISQEAMAFL